MRLDYRDGSGVWVLSAAGADQLTARAYFTSAIITGAVCCHHLISTCAREHSRLRVETDLRSVSSRQGSRNIRDKREHINLGRAVPDRLSDSRLVETTR